MTADKGTVKKYDKRLDIQGLRMLAVVAVILDHTFSWPSAGYLGVDVFFVISGFIITGLLLRQYDTTGSISFVDFYRRRIKRIMPLALLVLAVTVVASFVLFRAARATSIAWDSIWAALFAGNWRFAITGTDYWAQGSATSPVQHFWSLSVEEQFYFVWPWLLLGLLVLTRRKGGAIIFATMGVIVAASFCWGIYETLTNPSVAYFSTFSRAWELGLGALIALTTGLLARIPDALRPVLAYLGLGGILVSFFVTDEALVPAPGAGLAVVSTALVIAANVGGSQAALWPLTNRVSVYLGDISYSLYLWHFPLIVLLLPIFGGQSVAYYVTVLSITVVVSVLSYHFFEDRIRRSAWLEPKRRSRRPRRDGVGVAEVVKYATTGALAIVVTVGAVYAYQRVETPVPVVAAVTSTSAPTPSAALAVADQAADVTIKAGLTSALEADVWPQLTPDIDALLTEGLPEEDSAGCSNADVTSDSSCYFPNEGATQEVVVLGDSTGITLLPTVRAALGDGFNYRGMTEAGCVPLSVDLTFGSTTAKNDCNAHRAASIDAINTTKPAVVFITSMQGYIGNLSSKASGAGAVSEWQAGTTDLLAKLAPSGARLVVVSAPPLGKSLTDCATNLSSPADCTYEMTDAYPLINAAYRKATADVAGAGMIDVGPWFCTTSGRCPAFNGDTPVKRDAVHTTRQYALELAPAFLASYDALLSARAS